MSPSPLQFIHDLPPPVRDPFLIRVLRDTASEVRHLFPDPAYDAWFEEELARMLMADEEGVDVPWRLHAALLRLRTRCWEERRRLSEKSPGGMPVFPVALGQWERFADDWHNIDAPNGLYGEPCAQVLTAFHAWQAGENRRTLDAALPGPAVGESVRLPSGRL